MGDADPKRVVHRFGNPVLNGELVTFGQTAETLDTRFAVPRTEPVRVKMVDAVRNSELTHEWFETDTAGYNEDRSIILLEPGSHRATN